MAQLSPRVRAIIDANVPEADRPYYYRMASKEGAGGGTSPTGAKGLFQFTEGTGRSYGLLSKDSDRRGDDLANTQAMVRLTGDNRRTLRGYLGRDPNFSELALAHQQGADTAGMMLTGTGNAPRANLAVNNVDPNASPQEAARQIMNYYGFGINNRPYSGMSMNLTDPNAFKTPDQMPAGSIPYMSAFTPPGTTLTSNPDTLPAAAGAAPTGFMDRLLGADKQGGKGTPFADIVAGASDVAKGLTQKADPKLNEIIPTSGSSVDQRIASQQPLAQGLLTQMIQQMQARRGYR